MFKSTMVNSIKLLDMCSNRVPNNIQKLERLFSRDLFLEIKDSKGKTPLIYCVDKKDIDSVFILLNQGSRVNSMDNELRSPLMYSCWYNHDLDIMKLLLDHGANVKQKDMYGSSALHYASKIPFSKNYVEELLNHGADIDSLDDEGSNPLMCSALRGHSKNIEVLLDKGAYPHRIDDMGRTFLDYLDEEKRDEIEKTFKKELSQN